MQIEFRDAKTDHPSIGEVVLGFFLCRYLNAEWVWHGPHHCTWDGQGWSRMYSTDPEVWIPMITPPLPDCPERSAALLVAKKKKCLNARRDRLDAEYRALYR